MTKIVGNSIQDVFIYFPHLGKYSLTAFMCESIFSYKFSPLNAFPPPLHDCGGLTLAGCLTPIHLLSLTLLNSTRGENVMKSSEIEIKIIISYCHGYSSLNSGKINWIYWQLEWSWMMRNKLNHLPLTDFSSQAQLHFNVPNFYTSSPAWAVQGGWRIEGLQPVHMSSSLLLLPLCAFPVLWCGSLALWSFTNCRFFPWVKVQQDKPAAAWGVLESQFLTGEPASVRLSFHRLQHLPEACSCMGSPKARSSFRAHLLWHLEPFFTYFFPNLGVCRIVSLAGFSSLPVQHFALS